MSDVVTMETANGTPVVLKRYQKDLLLPVGIIEPEKRMPEIRNMKYRPGDIIVCCYPKCGTHWIGHMTRKLTCANSTDLLREALLEISDWDEIDAITSPRTLFTHLWPHRLPVDHLKNGGKLILLLRNPKSVAVSLYHHLRKSSVVKNAQTWDEFLSSFMDGKVLFGSFFDYIEEWGNAIKETIEGDSKMQVELFYFEEFKQDCVSSLERLSKFLECDRTKEELQKIADECSFDRLREEADRMPHHKNLSDVDGKFIIYRKGEVSDWKNYFTIAQNSAMDKMIESKLKCSPFSFIYE